MGELSSLDNDLDRIWIDPHSGGASPFVPEDPGVNPISRALEKAGMPNWLRSDSRFWIERGGRATVYSVFRHRRALVGALDRDGGGVDEGQERREAA